MHYALQPTVPQKPFWQRPEGVATLIGGAIVLTGGVVYALTRRSCVWSPTSIAALGTPGHYRMDAAVPLSVAGDLSSYPQSEQQWEGLLSTLKPKMPAGLVIEGLWLPAVSVGGQQRGPFSIPPNTPMPSDWPVVQDSALHIRVQMVWPYSSDIYSAILPLLAQEQAKQGLVFTVWSCPTGGPTGQALPLPLPVQWTIMQTDANSNVSLMPDNVYLLSAPATGGTFPQMQAALAQQVTVLGSWDTNQVPNDWPSDDLGAGRWRFAVANTTQTPISLTETQDEKIYSTPRALPSL